MPKLSEFTKATKPFTFFSKSTGITIQLEYYPYAIFGAPKLDNEGKPIPPSGFKAMASLIAWWDLTDDDGEMIPLDEDVLKVEFPGPLSGELIEAIMEDQKANPTKRGNSFNGSSTRARPVAHHATT